MKCTLLYSIHMFYLLVLQGKVLLYIAIPTCRAPEILDIVHDIYVYYAMQKSMLSVTLAAGIGQQGSVHAVSPTESYLWFESGRVRRVFVRQYLSLGRRECWVTHTVT
jgi:hypothetical protein